MLSNKSNTEKYTVEVSKDGIIRTFVNKNNKIYKEVQVNNNDCIAILSKPIATQLEEDNQDNKLIQLISDDNFDELLDYFETINEIRLKDKEVILPNFYIIELLKDINKSFNCRIYKKGMKVLASENVELNCFHVTNTHDTFKTNCAKKLYKFNGEEI